MKEAVEPIMRIITVLTASMCVWMVTTLIDVDRKAYGLQIEMEHVREFTKQPRFTKDDFNSGIDPIEQRLKDIERRLKQLEQ